MPHGTRIIRTARLTLRPVGWSDLPEITKLKGDPAAFAQMLGGVRTPTQAASDMADDVAFWGKEGVGIFTIREDGVFRGITGVHERPDGRGIGLRFALHPSARGRGLAREAAAAALRFAHDEGIRRVVAVSRAENRSSRLVLGSIGMTLRDQFERDGHTMLLYESIRRPQE
jgi:RimJ/RimL family protein N-acetyltransferase